VEGLISHDDLDSLRVTDDPDEAVHIVVSTYETRLTEGTA
jgi:hypothetical protein